MSYKNAMAFAQTAASMPDGSTYLKHHREILKTLSGEGEATVGHVAEASRIAADTATQPNPKEAIEQFHHKRREAQDRATTQAFETRKTNAERTVLAFATNTDTGLGLDRKAASEFLNQVAAHQDWAQFLSIYQAAVAYAHYEEQGLGVSIWEARKFADQVMTHSNPPEYLRHHKIALDYAYNEEGGLALSGASARKFADEVANRPNLDDYLRRHAIALAHAYNEESGLALSGAAAKNFADETVKRPDMEEYLQQHQAALAHAYGLGLSGTTARKYADEKYADEMVQQPNREQALRARAPVPPGSSSSRANWLNRFGRSAKIGGGTGFLVGAGLVGGSARTFVSG